MREVGTANCCCLIGELARTKVVSMGYRTFKKFKLRLGWFNRSSSWRAQWSLVKQTVQVEEVLGVPGPNTKKKYFGSLLWKVFFLPPLLLLKFCFFLETKIRFKKNDNFSEKTDL